MSSELLSVLAKLDESVRVLEGRLDCLGAGLNVSKEQFVQNVMEARQNVDAIRELIFVRRPDVDWADRRSLETLIRDLEAAEAGRKELRLTRLLELAEELNAGTITHRLKSRVTVLEGTRELAVRELLTEAANDEPKDLPGPHASVWMQWAFGLQNAAHTAQFSRLEKDFPALVIFVCDMEESYWRPRESTPEIREGIAHAEAASAPQTTVEQPSSTLSASASAFAARYGHLSAAKASQLETTAETNKVSVAAPEVPELYAVNPPVLVANDSASQAVQHSTTPEAPPYPSNGSAPDAPSPSISVEESAKPAKPLPVERQPAEPEPYLSFLSEPVEAERSRSRFGLNRSALITVGAIAAIVLVMVVISAVSGSVTGKRSSTPPATVASDSSKESPAVTPAAPVSDIELVGQLEQRLKVISGSAIYVTVQHETAILEGQVPSEEALSQAEELTLQSSQIKVVRDRLQVKSSGVGHSTSSANSPNPANAE